MLFLVCSVYIQDQDINGLEFQTIEIPGNKKNGMEWMEEWMGFWAKTCTSIP